MLAGIEQWVERPLEQRVERGIEQSKEQSKEQLKEQLKEQSTEQTMQQSTVQSGSLRSGGLSSARDRVRLRAREVAERARVERVLARGPRDVERRRGALRVDRAAQSRAEQGRPRRAARLGGANAGCAVCGGSEIHEDEVFEGGFIRLGWCRRCDHRWTERLSPRFVPRVRRPESRARSRTEAEVGGGA